MANLAQLVNKLGRSGVLQTPKIKEAFHEIDRVDFVREEHIHAAYSDRPLPIGSGQTISQPTTVAFMLERLQPKEGEKVLDVGSGSGWTTALLNYIVGPKGTVIGVERISDLVKFGRVNLKKYGYDHTQIVQAGEEIGWSQEAPYDKILTSAAAQKVPQELVEQLKDGGVLVIPVKSSIYKITKKGKDYEKEEFYGFSFVPLVEGLEETEEEI